MCVCDMARTCRANVSLNSTLDPIVANFEGPWLVPIALFDGNVREAVVEAVTLAGDGRWDLPTEKAEEDLGVKLNVMIHTTKNVQPKKPWSLMLLAYCFLPADRHLTFINQIINSRAQLLLVFVCFELHRKPGRSHKPSIRTGSLQS